VKAIRIQLPLLQNRRIIRLKINFAKEINITITSMKNKYSAFSLIELSIVILIIGIIIAGVTQGSRLVRQFKLSAAKTLTTSAPVASIKGLIFWFEPTLDTSFLEAQTEEGTEITQWNDNNPQSSVKYFAVPLGDNTGAAYSESAGPNGLPSLLFDGDTDSFDVTQDAAGLLSSAIPTQNGAFTFFVVSKTMDVVDNHVLLSNGDREGGAADGWDYATLADQAQFLSGAADNSDMSSDVFTAGTSVVTSASFNPSNANIYFYTNGTNVLTDGSLMTAPTTTYHIGYRPENTTLYWNGYISEVIVFDRSLKNEERKSVEQYLGKKYGIRVVE